jgi:hypothetical protein
MYGSGSKQEDMDGFRYGQQIDMFDDLMLADDETGTDSSSSSAFMQDSKIAKSNHDRNDGHRSNKDSTRTRDRTGSHDNLYDAEVTTPLVEELSQLPQYDDEREHSKSDNVESVTSSWHSTTRKHRHRHHHTSSQTQSSEHLQSLHIRQVRSTTTKSKYIVAMD